VVDEISFDWDEANMGHIARHGVTPEEAQEVFANGPTEFGSRFVDGEERFQIVGFTNSGRWLCVITTERGENVVWSRPMTQTIGRSNCTCAAKAAYELTDSAF